jgi:hypothetical protein
LVSNECLFCFHFIASNKGNTLTESSEDRDRDGELIGFFVQLRRDFEARVPPGCDPMPYVRKAALEYKPPDRAADRMGAVLGATRAARKLLIPVWREVYLDPRRRKEALDDILRRRHGRFPVIDRTLVTLSSECQFVYLIWDFLGFGINFTVRVTGLDQSTVRDLYHEVGTRIRSDRQP